MSRLRSAVRAVREPPLQVSFCRRPKSSASIIGATCAFDAKIYKIVDGIFNVSSCGGVNKKNFKLFYFCSALPSLLVENSLKIVNRNAIAFVYYLSKGDIRYAIYENIRLIFMPYLFSRT